MQGRRTGVAVTYPPQPDAIGLKPTLVDALQLVRASTFWRFRWRDPDRDAGEFKGIGRNPPSGADLEAPDTTMQLERIMTPGKKVQAAMILADALLLRIQSGDRSYDDWLVFALSLIHFALYHAVHVHPELRQGVEVEDIEYDIGPHVIYTRLLVEALGNGDVSYVRKAESLGHPRKLNSKLATLRDELVANLDADPQKKANLAGSLLTFAYEALRGAYEGYPARINVANKDEAEVYAALEKTVRFRVDGGYYTGPLFKLA